MNRYHLSATAALFLCLLGGYYLGSERASECGLCFMIGVPLWFASVLCIETVAQGKGFKAGRRWEQTPRYLRPQVLQKQIDELDND